MALEIKQLTAIQWKGINVVIPEDLLLTNAENQTFLKLRPSHHSITKLVCPDCKKKNLSLSAGPRLMNLVSLVHAQSLEKETMAEGQEEGAESLFGSEEQRPKKKQKKECGKLSEASVVVTLPDDFGSLTAMWPSSKHADVAILLEASNVQKCLECLEADCSTCAEGAKRSYNKSGKFVKPISD